MFHETLINLLKTKKSVNSISVRSLCEEAQLNRSTFYAHYQSVADVLSEIEEEIMFSTSEYFKKIGSNNMKNLYIFKIHQGK